MTIFLLFLKFIYFYCLCYYSCSCFFYLSPSPPSSPSPAPKSIPILLSVSMGCAQMFFGWSLHHLSSCLPPSAHTHPFPAAVSLFNISKLLLLFCSLVYSCRWKIHSSEQPSHFTVEPHALLPCQSSQNTSDFLRNDQKGEMKLYLYVLLSTPIW